MTVIDSTIARNAAVAHVGGGIWSRERPVRRPTRRSATTTPRARAAGSSPPGSSAWSTRRCRQHRPGRARTSGADATGGLWLGHRPAGHRRPSAARCSRPGPTAGSRALTSFGYNFVSDDSCGLDGAGDVVGTETQCSAASWRTTADVGETRQPLSGQPGHGPDSCRQPCRFALRLRRSRASSTSRGSESIPWLRSQEINAGSVVRRVWGVTLGRSSYSQAPAAALSPLPNLNQSQASGGLPADSNGKDADASNLMAVSEVQQRDATSPRGHDRRRHRSGRPLPSKVRRLERHLALNQGRVELMERIARNFHHWMTCVSPLPVSEYGDPDHRFGFLYNEMGTEPGSTGGLRSPWTPATGVAPTTCFSSSPIATTVKALPRGPGLPARRAPVTTPSGGPDTDLRFGRECVRSSAGWRTWSKGRATGHNVRAFR